MKKKIKILHTADWHLGLVSWKTRREVDRGEEQREALENQIEQHNHIIMDLYDEIDYHEREVKNLQTLLNDDSNLEDAVSIKEGR